MPSAHAAAGGGSRRFLWGGLGALAPTIISLAILDHTTLAEYISDIDEKTFEIGGYAFRVLALFAIGGLWAFFHRTEVEPLKLFQLGIVAPAMITGMINASNVSSSPGSDASAWLDLRFELVSSAYAQDVSTVGDDGSPPEPTPVQQFINGILGRP
jgi:hypothetical protein